MAVSYPAPALCQGSDEDLLVRIGEVVFPEFVKRPEEGNGLRLSVEDDPGNPETGSLAAARFQTLLVALRVFRTDAGELAEELRNGLGQGSVRDETGNQFVSLGTVRSYAIVGGEVEAFATDLRAAIENSKELRNALWLNGRPGRTAADYYMIHEYATTEFRDEKGVRDSLKVSRNDQKKLTASANNLSPLEGGRHAPGSSTVTWGLREQRDFTAELLTRWIKHGASAGVDS